MTGNTSQLSSEVSSTDLNDIIFFGSIILAFVTGAILARIIVIWGIIHNIRPVLPDPVCRRVITDRYFGLRDVFPCPHQQPHNYYLSLWSDGDPHSTSTQLSSGRVRSTHITGTLTDAGISLASVVVAMLRRDYSKDTAAQKSQLKTHLTTLFSFITGGIAGLLLFRWIGFNAMLALGVILALVSVCSMITIAVRVRKVRAALGR